MCFVPDAEEIHKFISEATEINDRMNEKAKGLNVHDYGKDLEGVQSLLMRHHELEKDLTAIEDKLEVNLNDDITPGIFPLLFMINSL